MKTILLSFSFAFLLPAFCFAESLTVKVGGMHCEDCAKSIQKEVKALPNILDVNVDVQAKTATVTSKEGTKISVKDLQKAIEKAGFKYLG